MSDFKLDITQTIMPVLTQMGYELVGIEYIKNGKHSILRIYIDIDRGINVEDCVRVSEQVSAILDVEEPLAGQYHLEVSSPGIARPLFTLAHYRRFLGSNIKLRLLIPQKGKRQWTGEIKRVLELENGIELATELDNVILLLSNIEKANLVVDF